MTTVAMTVEQEDRQDYFTLNADAQPCITDTAPPVLKWINLEIDFCSVDPQMITLLTGDPLVLDDTATPIAVGWRTNVGSAATVNFGFEGWTRIGGAGGASCATNAVRYGYALMPWCIEGMMGDVTFENGAATFTVTARTEAGGPWGVGPYNVLLSNAASTLGVPLPLLTAIGSTTHRHLQVTTLPPPPAVCGYQAIPAGPLTIGHAALVATLTLPTGAPNLLPAYVNWGDATAPQLVTVGPTVPHTYGIGGTYTVTYAPTSFSGPVYSGTVTVP